MNPTTAGIIADVLVAMTFDESFPIIEKLKPLIDKEHMEGSTVIRRDGMLGVIQDGSPESELIGPDVDGFKVQSDGPLRMIQASLLAYKEGKISEERARNLCMNTMNFIRGHLAGDIGKSITKAITEVTKNAEKQQRRIERAINAVEFVELDDIVL